MCGEPNQILSKRFIAIWVTRQVYATTPRVNNARTAPTPVTRSSNATVSFVLTNYLSYPCGVSTSPLQQVKRRKVGQVCRDLPTRLSRRQTFVTFHERQCPWQQASSYLLSLFSAWHPARRIGLLREERIFHLCYTETSSVVANASFMTDFLQPASPLSPE